MEFLTEIQKSLEISSNTWYHDGAEQKCTQSYHKKEDPRGVSSGIFALLPLVFFNPFADEI
jgi:hypothetical protein